MKASKFTDAQKAFILKQGADGVPVAEICRRAGISQATYFRVSVVVKLVLASTICLLTGERWRGRPAFA